MSDVTTPVKKPRAPRKAKPVEKSKGNKTLAAALAAAVLAALDLYMQFRHGMKWPF